MTEEHQHTQPIFSCNNQLKCKDCLDLNEVHNNQCFHICHQKGKDNCKGCAIYHQ